MAINCTQHNEYKVISERSERTSSQSMQKMREKWYAWVGEVNGAVDFFLQVAAQTAYLKNSNSDQNLIQGWESSFVLPVVQ